MACSNVRIYWEEKKGDTWRKGKENRERAV
jgi:hypothetical protein